MDNFYIDVTSEGEKNLKLALEIALSGHLYATHWAVHPNRGMVLFWSKPEEVTFFDAKQVDYLPQRGKPGARLHLCKETDHCGRVYQWVTKKQPFDPEAGDWEKVKSPPVKKLEVHPFPFKMKRVEDLLPFVTGWLKETDYGNEPDHDGSNGKGWRVYNHNWGQVIGCGSYSFVAIEPAWAMYGK